MFAQHAPSPRIHVLQRPASPFPVTQALKILAGKELAGPDFQHEVLIDETAVAESALLASVRGYKSSASTAFPATATAVTRAVFALESGGAPV